jgi:hypothetical protein
LFFLPFTWGRHRRARVTTALPGATSLELLILFALSLSLSLSYYACPLPPLLLPRLASG